MEENKKKIDNEEMVSNSFLNENLKVLEDKEKEFEVNLNTINKSDVEYEEYNYNEYEKEEEPIKNSDSDNIFSNDYLEEDKKGFDISIIFLILSFISVAGLFLSELLKIIGLVLCVISLFGAMLTLNRRHKFSEIAFSSSLIIAIIYVVIYVITLTKIDTSIDKEKAKIFKERAGEIIESIRKEVTDNNLLKCNARGISEKKMVMSSLNETSPFGYQYNRDMSYVLVEAYEEDGKCVYRYSIYLTDDNYSLGTIVEPVLEDRVLQSNIRKVTKQQN